MNLLAMSTRTPLVRLFFTIVLFPLVMSSAGGGGLHRCRKPQKSGAALFIFGDSYFDPGNNNFINTTTLDQANFWPYGETYFKFPTGRFSDGRLITDFISEYAKLPLIPPFLQPGSGRDYFNGVNFASAGAGTLVETFQGAAIDLRTQLLYYKKVKAWLRRKLGEAESKMKLSNAVYMFSIGSNDYISPFLTNATILASYSSSEYVEMVIGNLTAVVKAIYEDGGRKFSFLNVGDLGCLPGLRILRSQSKGKCLAEASTLAKLHNQALHKFLSEMEDHLPGLKISIYDYYRGLRHRMNYPSNFGFEEGKTACCGAGRFRGIFSCGGKRRLKEFELCPNPNEYVIWDSYHLTENTYKQMAGEMWSGYESNQGYSLKTLFQCR